MSIDSPASKHCSFLRASSRSSELSRLRVLMFVLVMGVTGSGKSTLGKLLADRLGLPFHDADDYHPPENRAKMAADIPLDEEDRRPWLALLAQLAVGWQAAGGAVLACSALKQAYRELLL